MHDNENVKKWVRVCATVIFLFIILPLVLQNYINLQMYGDSQFQSIYAKGIVGSVIMCIGHIYFDNKKRKKEVAVEAGKEAYVCIKQHTCMVSGDTIYATLTIENPLPYHINDVKVVKINYKNQSYQEKIIALTLESSKAVKIGIVVNKQTEQYKIRMSSKIHNIYEQKLFFLYDNNSNVTETQVFLTMAKQINI